MLFSFMEGLAPRDRRSMAEHSDTDTRSVSLHFFLSDTLFPPRILEAAGDEWFISVEAKPCRNSSSSALPTPLQWPQSAIVSPK